MSELGRVVYNMANVVVGGVVCFFPSYEYEKTVLVHWEQAGFLEKINQKKKVGLRAEFLITSVHVLSCLSTYPTDSYCSYLIVILKYLAVLELGVRVMARVSLKSHMHTVYVYHNLSLCSSG